MIGCQLIEIVPIIYIRNMVLLHRIDEFESA